MGGHPKKNRLLWLYTRVRRKICSWAPFTNGLVYRAICRAYDEMLQVALNIQTDLFIAHNIGTLPIAASAARTQGVQYAFDAEDFHRGEYSPDQSQSKWVQKIEAAYLPATSYLTASSPLIAEAYQKQFADKQALVIQNVFPLAFQKPLKTIENSPLRLFWFSQTTGLNRGLQDVLCALTLLSDIPISLNITGEINDSTQKALSAYISSNIHEIRFAPPVPEAELFETASKQHIGLALEPGFSQNNSIALSNKIFTYLIAGNAILASDTPAQMQFIAKNPKIGWCYPKGKPEKIAEILRHCYNNPEILNQARSNAWNAALERYNWDIEQRKFLETVSSLFNA